MTPKVYKIKLLSGPCYMVVKSDVVWWYSHFMYQWSDKYQDYLRRLIKDNLECEATPLELLIATGYSVDSIGNI